LSQAGDGRDEAWSSNYFPVWIPEVATDTGEPNGGFENGYTYLQKPFVKKELLAAVRTAPSPTRSALVALVQSLRHSKKEILK
jgi:hypothetical protein